VKSTYNWYWLVDGLQENGYRMHLAHPSAIRQYEGLKHTDDKWDAFWLAQLLQLGILPQGYIYPKAERPTRDLLRRRLLFVRHHRTAHILSLQSMVQRCCGRGISANEIKKMTPPEASAMFSELKKAESSRDSKIMFFSTARASVKQARMNSAAPLESCTFPGRCNRSKNCPVCATAQNTISAGSAARTGSRS
jgi:hypothetical protein